MTVNKNEADNLLSTPKVFTFNPSNQPIRVEVINNEPHFVAKDVCDCLSISNSRDAVDRLDEDEKGVSLVATPSRKQKMQVVNESGLYNLIFQSRKPEAKAFRKWVTSEVLPAIRKTGKYAISHPRQVSGEMPGEMLSKPTNCLVLHCRRYDGTVKHLFVHYNMNDAWFNEPPVDMANAITGAIACLPEVDKSVKEYSFRWYKVEENGYRDTGITFRAKDKTAMKGGAL
ncbi:hypothetical protein FACS1894180_9370 [Bacteroidia bacterium]|nr:hypothetical protein FACS1894180_9370 [Bacteroidia bacterium]